MAASPVRRKYTPEFKREAVELAKSHGGPVAEVARDLGIRPNLLYRWIKEYEQDGWHAFPGLGKRKEPDAEQERLRRELRRVKLERDILKKALAIFSRVSPNDTSS